VTVDHGPGELALLRGHFYIRRPNLTTYVAECQLMLYNIRVEFPTVEVDVDKLQELRINRGLSQRRLADLAGVSNTSVWKIEQGGGANPATLKKLADVLGVLPTDLLKKGR
jgi:DNA-binding XRE family transcriptional regulator